MKIELDLTSDKVDEDGEPILLSIEEAAIAAVTDRITASIEEHVKAKVEAELFASVSSRISSWVEAALLRPVQQTDNFGHPIGKPQSFEEYVEITTRKHLGEVVNAAGVIQGWDTRQTWFTRAELAIRRYAEETIQKDVRDHLEQHREQLAKAIGEIVAASATAIKT